MRTYKNELDVDFIGGQNPLTAEEEKTISEFIKANKLKQAKTKTKKVRSAAAKQTVKL